MKKFCVTLCILLFCNLLLAQNKRQEKRLLKSLKKEYGLYDAYFERSWRDNYVYIGFTENSEGLCSTQREWVFLP